MRVTSEVLSIWAWASEVNRFKLFSATTITDRVLVSYYAKSYRPERNFYTTMSVKSPHKRFAAVTYVWSRDLIGFFFTRKGNRGSVSGASRWDESKYHSLSAKSATDCHAIGSNLGRGRM